MKKGRSSRTDMDVQPTTSGIKTEGSFLTRDFIRFELIARSLSRARDGRDKRESAISARLTTENPDLSVDEIKAKVAEELNELNAHIETEEKRIAGDLLEDILKNPIYNYSTLEELIPNLPRSSLKDIIRTEAEKIPLQPIEIQVDVRGLSESKDEPPHSTVSTNDTNVEKAAKMEAHVLQRVAELRKQGLWTSSRLPICVDPPRNKTHWDYLLEEVRWMANDFRQERVFKRKMARTLSTAIAKQRRDQELEAEKAEQRIIKDGKKMCASVAKMVKEFWMNVDKVVEYRAQEILESKKRKALDQHLAFIVGEADKLSSMVQEGLTNEKSSNTPSVISKQDQDDHEFSLGEEEESDNESTLSKEEELKEGNYEDELTALNKDAHGDLDDLLASLPPDYLASMGLSLPTTCTVSNSDRASSAMSIVESVSSSSRDMLENQINEKDGGKSDMVDQNDEGNGDGRGVLKDVDYAKLNSSNANEREEELAHIAEQALMFQPKGFTLETTQVKTPVPYLIRGSLREYQMVGLDWLVTLYEKNLNGILADEMGLGKTIQTISLLAHLAATESIWGPHLIVVPTSVILNWEMELKKWCPAFKILTYFGNVKERAEKRKGWSKPNAFHVCITSYKTITADIRSFKMKAWQYMILDEAQNIKNWKSQRWQALLNIRARRRLLLTGTPLQNSLMELWSLMHFLMPAIFASHDDFKDWFSNPLTGMMEGNVEYNAPLVQRLHKILRPFILRRLKTEVEKQLPRKTETVVKCQLSKRQRYLYDDFMSRRTTKENLKTGNMFSVLNIVMQLRKCCNHPNLFEPRAVLSPLILQPITKVVPGLIFDLIGKNSPGENVNKIPECFNLANRLTGWSFNEFDKKPTIEELRIWDTPRKPPKLDDFHFSVPPLLSERISFMNASPTASILDGLSAAEIQRAGLKENEQLLIISEHEDKSIVNGDGGHALKVRLQGDRLVVDRSAKPANLDSRLCKLVTINGEKVLVDVSKNGEAGSCEPTIPEPSSASLPSSSASITEKKPTRSTQGASVTVSLRSPGLKRNVAVHPSFKAHTRTFSPSLAILPDVKGFNQVMANGGVREDIANFNYRFSPPLKRKKISEIPLLSGLYTTYVPKDYKKRLADENVNKLELAQSKFCSYEKPFYSNELIFALQIAKTDEDKRDIVENIASLQESLKEHIDILLNKFPAYVVPALADCPTIVASSRGRTFSSKLAERTINYNARRFLRAAPAEVEYKLLSSRLQFPELRLIEYDCGKLQILANLLRQLYLYKHRCLIFTQMSKMLDILQAFLSYHGYQYFRLDGTTGIEQRQHMMERFNADSRIFCFILSTRSGGVGVNLTGADTVIFYDSDWNPTMDAQAQDRCHRIGQTRNVAIYRLISEKTIEENILKKAMQKRRLGEMAIDDAGFTPDFFKQPDNLRDLFESDAADIELPSEVSAPNDQRELENVMASLEDEQDVAASKKAVAEARADRAEFDEAKRDAVVSSLGSDEIQDDKYIELINQLKPIERYALQFLEAEYKPEFDEECKEAEALIEQKKEVWERAHDKAATDNGLCDDDFYGGGSILDEVLACDNIFAELPTWCPPTPPLSPSQENDIYYDECLDLLYDPDFMGESKLPSTIHELHRPLLRTPSPVKKHPVPPSAIPNKNKAVMDLLNAATLSAYSSAAASPSNYEPSNYFSDYGTHGTDLNSAALDPYGQAFKKERRERSGRDRDQNSRINREAPRPITPPSSIYEQEDYEGPEWTIAEDLAIVEAIQQEDQMGHTPGTLSCSLHYNWKYIAEFVNKTTAPTGHYRSDRQCCIRYQMAVRPREAGHLHTVDPLTRKPRKVPLTQNELNHLKKNRSTTKSQYEYDHPQIVQDSFVARSKLVRDLNKKSKKPLKSYADALPQIVPTHMPDSFENKLLELKLNNLRTVFPEDMVRKQEEVHYAALEASRQRAAEKQLDADTERGIPPQISLRNSAIPTQGFIESKAPYMLELPAVQTRPPPPPRPMLHPSGGLSQLMGNDVGSMHTISTAVPRRVGSASTSMAHMATTGNYVVVGQNEHAAGLRVQRTDAGPTGPGGSAMFRSLGSQQIRRTPPGTPLISGHSRPVSYVSAQSASGGTNYVTNQPGGSMYPGSSSLNTNPRQPPPGGRIASRPGQQGRIFVNSERSAYLMGHPSPSHVRVVPGGNVQRVQTGGVQKRMPSKQPGTLATMVMPNARAPGPPGAGVQQFRTVPNNFSRPVARGGNVTQGTRLMNVVMTGGSTMRNPQGHMMGQTAMTRQLLTSRTIPSRTGSPQTIAQVVIAPPANMQQQPQSQSIASQPLVTHPPSLTSQADQSPGLSEEASSQMAQTPPHPIPNPPSSADNTSSL